MLHYVTDLQMHTTNTILKALTMNTMLRILEMVFAWTNCSTISPAVRLPFKPMVPASSEKCLKL